MSQEMTAARTGMMNCAICHLVVRVSAQEKKSFFCPRCGARLALRKHFSLGLCWAYLISAFILYFPAMILPVMETNTLYFSRKDTIFSGVVYLFTSGTWPLGVIVFGASIMIPVVKIVVLAALLISVQRKTAWAPEKRTRAFHIIEIIGRWSMVDIFVITITVALVQLPALAMMEVAPGAVCFGAVVILTMLATLSFDPRLIWDNVSEPLKDRKKKYSLKKPDLPVWDGEGESRLT